ALQPDPGERQPLRAGADRPDPADRDRDDDRALALARAGAGHLRGAARLAAAPVADHPRQGAPLPRPGTRECRLGPARGAPRLPGPARRQPHPAAGGKHALRDGRPRPGRADRRGHLVAARRDARLRRRDDAAEPDALRDDLPDREHAGAPAGDLPRHPGALVHHDMSRHHAEGRRPARSLAGTRGARGDVPRPDRGGNPPLERSAGLMLRTLRVLLRKEFTQIRRDPVILRMLFVMPVIQLVVLANAATFEVKRADLWVVDQDRTEVSRGVVQALTASRRFTVVDRSATEAPADTALIENRADVVL